jgi:hypothetical protein
MKKTILGILALFAILALIHISIWPLNKSLHESLKAQEKELNEFHDIKSTRLQLESQGAQELKKYRWIDQRKEYAEIPLERAFHYYLKRR